MQIDIWAYRGQADLETTDIVGFGVEALDGSIGKIDKASDEVGSSYIVVDTGPWIFGQKVMLPAGVIDRIDLAEEKVYVHRDKEQIKDAPSYDEAQADTWSTGVGSAPTTKPAAADTARKAARRQPSTGRAPAERGSLGRRALSSSAIRTFRSAPPRVGTRSSAKPRERDMYIGIGTVALIVLIVLLVLYVFLAEGAPRSVPRARAPTVTIRRDARGGRWPVEACALLPLRLPERPPGRLDRGRCSRQEGHGQCPFGRGHQGGARTAHRRDRAGTGVAARHHAAADRRRLRSGRRAVPSRSSMQS